MRKQLGSGITWVKFSSLVAFSCFFGSSSVSDNDNDDEGLTWAGDSVIVGEILLEGGCCSLRARKKKRKKKKKRSNLLKIKPIFTL